MAGPQGATRLEPQVAKLLAFFLANQNRVISRDELIASVWDARVVSDDAVNRCISILRQTLSPDDTHAFIETVIRRGYIAHFPPAPEPDSGPGADPGPGPEGGDLPGPEPDRQEAKPAPAPSGGRKTGRGPYLAAALLALVVLASILWFAGAERERGPSPQVAADGPPVVAVLPFATSGRGDDGPFFAGGVHEDLLTQLAQLQSLRVISRTSVLEYGSGDSNLREIGRELGADAILEGSVQSIGGNIRINVQLIDVLTDAHLWAETYDRELSAENLFAVQSEIARAIAAAMHATLTPQDTTQLAILPTDSMAAYRAYHEAMEVRDSASVNDPAYIAALERAVALDPGYVRAWVELAGILSFRHFSDQDDAWVVRVEQIIDHVAALAPDSADYLIAQAYYTYYILRNYNQAYRLINQAHEMRPSDVRLLELKSWIARRAGDFEGKIEAVRLVRELDPRDPERSALLVSNLVMAHRYDQASIELESFGVANYELAFLKSTLDVRRHGDLARWANEVAAIVEEYGSEAHPADLWDALVAARDYTAAEALARQWPVDFQRDDGTSFTGLPDRAYYQLLSYWFLQLDGPLEQQVTVLRQNVDNERLPDGGLAQVDHYLVVALLAAVEGEHAEAGRVVRRWQRVVAEDLAELWGNRHFACRVLGMAAETAAAVECIRSALAEPSQAIRFIEPRLPYYDPIREQPAFVELLDELGEG